METCNEGKAKQIDINISRTNNFVYLVREREFIKTGEQIYKIGKTSQYGLTRFSQYPSGSELILHIQCSDCSIIEQMIMNSFTSKYKHMKDIGREYFEGDKLSMMSEIINLAMGSLDGSIISEKDSSYEEIKDQLIKTKENSTFVTLTDTQCNNIASAKIIDEKKYEKLRKKQRLSKISFPLVRKYQLMKFYGMEPLTMDGGRAGLDMFNDPNLVKFYSRKKTQKCFLFSQYRCLPREVVEKIDEDNKNNKNCHYLLREHLSETHEFVNSVRELVGSGIVGNDKLIEFMKLQSKNGSKFIEGTVDFGPINTTQIVNKILFNYCYKLDQIRRTRDRTRKWTVTMGIVDISATMFNVKHAKPDDDIEIINSMKNDRNSNIPVLVIYSI